MTQPVDHTSNHALAKHDQVQLFGQLTNFGSIVGSAKNELWRSVVPGANIRHIRFVLDQNFGAAEIAQLQHTSRRVQQEILGLDIPVADALRVDISKRAE